MDKMDKKKESERRRLTLSAAELAEAGIAFLCGVCPLSPLVSPFGLAYLFSKTKLTLPLAAGLVLSLPFSPQPLVYALLYLLGFALLWLSAGRKLPAAARAALCVAFSAVLALTASPFSGADGFVAALFAFVAVPGFAYLFPCAAAAKQPGRLLCGRLAFAYVAVRAMSVFAFSFFRPELLLAFFLTLAAGVKSPYSSAGLCGFVCALAADLHYMPALIVLGLLFGLFAKKNVLAALFPTFAFAVVANAYLLDFRDLAPLLVNACCALAAFLPVHKRVPVLFPEQSEADGGGAPDKRPFSLSAFSACFSSLSQVFYTVNAETKQTNATETCRRVQQAALSVCSACGGCACDKRDLCNNLMKHCLNEGFITEEQLPDHIRFGCKRKQQLVEAVNAALAKGRDESARAVAMLAEEYSAFSRLLNEAYKKEESEQTPDREAGRRVRELLFSKGVVCDKVRVTGARRRVVEVNGVLVDKLDCTSRQLTEELSALLGVRLSPPQFLLNDGYATMRFETVCRFSVESAKASCAKDGETLCGDTASFFEHDDYFYALIADGMGSGRDAALTSRLAAIYLEKLLCVGADKGDALRMLNKVLMAKKDEVFTTIDLIEIDKLTGEATLVKAGAAPSYLLRGGDCTKLESRTLPAGIMPAVKAEQIKLRLRRGDCLVMLSDGITQNRSYTPAVSRPGSAKELVTALMRRASAQTECADDMSVAALRIF